MVYPTGDISPPPGVKAAMEMQAEAERRRRAQVLESEGDSCQLIRLVILIPPYTLMC